MYLFNYKAVNSWSLTITLINAERGLKNWPLPLLNQQYPLVTLCLLAAMLLANNVFVPA